MDHTKWRRQLKVNETDSADSDWFFNQPDME